MPNASADVLPLEIPDRTLDRHQVFAQNLLKIIGHNRVRGAGRSTSIISRVTAVPAGRSLAARRQRRCSTTVSCSLAATNLSAEPSARSKRRVVSTISAQSLGFIANLWSGPHGHCCR